MNPPAIGLLAATVVACAVVAGCAGGPQPGDAAVPTTTVTATVTATVTETVEAPTPAAASQEDLPSPEDFAIDLRTTEKKCFGSAGCNVTVSIDPSYIGVDLLPEEFEVTYEIRGGEDGPQVNTFSVEGDTITYDSEESLSTSSSDAQLEAVVTDVWS